MPDSRRAILVILIAALVPAFAITHTVVAAYKGQRDELAREWNRQGNADLPSRPGAAVAISRPRCPYAPDEADTRYRLAEALIGVSRFAEAKAQLITLWTEEPGDGPVNLQLAHLAASTGEIDEAVRYYHAAIDGAWESAAAVSRRTARIELAKLLLREGQQTPRAGRAHRDARRFAAGCPR